MVGGTIVAAEDLRNRKEVASGREDREVPHVIELVERVSAPASTQIPSSAKRGMRFLMARSTI
jgi:hypothetical protein